MSTKMTPVLFLSGLISLVFVHSEVIKPQLKDYTIVTHSYSTNVWYLCNDQKSCINYNSQQIQYGLNCPEGNTSQLCSCYKTFGATGANIGLIVKQLAFVDMERSVIRLQDGTVCDYKKESCQFLKNTDYVGVCWEYTNKLHVQPIRAEEYTINSNTFLDFDYEGSRTTLQLLHVTQNNTQLWCTNRLDMVVYKGSLDKYDAMRTKNMSLRELGCYPKIIDSIDKNTESESVNNNIKTNDGTNDNNNMHEMMIFQKFQQFSDSFWVIKFVCIPVIAALILLHMILSCLQFKSLNDLKKGKSVKQEKIQKSNNKANKNQTNPKETYYETVNYDAINEEIKPPSIKTVDFKTVENDLYKEH
ncbi:uncharacterized protein LOC114328662 isoform X1 [Diabrotica virgifera virgifera]|uniref:Uncharacterized protein n=1 Tax=Diabrotica virgifera virgifera TaxID=50390 RepID=A0ABM5KI24_DIAVI|nr:uncharacterized protein LOC114328662 isoform X1 [Diabrotica virgifera virgifera]